MSVQPQYHDEAFGYVAEIIVGQQTPRGPEISLELVTGRTVKLDFSSPSYCKAETFLRSMNELRSAQ